MSVQCLDYFSYLSTYVKHSMLTQPFNSLPCKNVTCSKKKNDATRNDYLYSRGLCVSTGCVNKNMTVYKHTC